MARAGARRSKTERLQCPCSSSPIPQFDPVLVQLGPFAIRWYALAYIAGILLGWVYARAIIRNERYWGGPAPLTVAEFDDFVLWVTLGIILGGRIGYVLFYNLPYFASHPLQMFQLWHGGMSFHGGFTGCVIAVILFAKKRGMSILSLGDITCAVGPIGLFLGRTRQFHQRRALGPADRRALGHGLSQRRPDPAPPEPALRGDAGRPGAAGGALSADPRRRPEAAGADHRLHLPVGYAVARSFCEFFREPDPQLGFLWGGATMGQLLSIPLFLAGLCFIIYA